MRYRSIVFLFVLSLALGFGTAARAESEDGSRISFHGYGEMHYNNPETSSSVPDPDDPAVMDFHRMVLGWTAALTDRIRLQVEVDFEHAATELELEFAYLEFDISPGLQVRAGSMMMPVGGLNEFHEPTLFYSVERPYVQAYIIPTTWQEGGVGVVGSLPTGLRYRVYLVSGLNAEGFSSNQGLRGGRTHVAEAPSDDLAVVGRLEYVGFPGFNIGGSYYNGGASQLETTPDDINVSIFEADLAYKYKAAEFRGTYAVVNVDNAGDLSTFLGETIGERMMGYYLEAALHLLPLLQPATTKDLVVFGRWEQFNTQEEVPSGFTADEANDRQVLTFGLAFYPDPNVAIKLDHERWEDEAGSDETRINAGIAYMF